MFLWGFIIVVFASTVGFNRTLKPTRTDWPVHPFWAIHGVWQAIIENSGYFLDIWNYWKKIEMETFYQNSEVFSKNTSQF